MRLCVCVCVCVCVCAYARVCDFTSTRSFLTVQVLSESVSKALRLTEEAQETAKLVGMFDRFFDCLNVNSFTKGRCSRKPFQESYRSAQEPNTDLLTH